jgi:20S proteasome alpha/beta subunit
MALDHYYLFSFLYTFISFALDLYQMGFVSSVSAMSIFEYNGSALVAMVGKNCFAIASDRRLGVQLQTIATDFQRIFKIPDKLYVGLSGLATDVQTLYQRFAFRHKLYQLRIHGRCSCYSVPAAIKRASWNSALHSQDGHSFCLAFCFGT